MNKNARLLAVLLTAFFVVGLVNFGAARDRVTYLTETQIKAIVDARIQAIVPPMIAEAIADITPVVEPEPEPEPVVEPDPGGEEVNPTVPIIIPIDPATNYINARDYGAKGDGVTDDKAAILNTINAAAAKGGGTAYIPGGVYKIGSQINLPSNVNILMASDCLLRTAVTTQMSVFWLADGVHDVTITGGILEGPAATAGMSENYNNGISMYCSGTADITNIIIRNVEIRYFRCDGIYVGGANTTEYCPNGVIVDGCRIHHCGRNGISLISHRNAQYLSNEISYIGLDNTATDTGAGIKFEVNASYGKNWVGENIKVEGNTCHHCHIFGIMVSDFWDRYENNDGVYGGAGGVEPYHPISITVRNNNCHDNATLGTGSYAQNDDNCLEVDTCTADRWFYWDTCAVVLHNASDEDGTWTW